MAVGELRLLAVGAVILAFEYGAFRMIRRRLADRPARRALFLVGGAVALGAAAGAALWLPGLLPETPGSPASLVWSLFSWGLGLMAALVGLPALFAAALPGPERRR